MKKTLCLLMSLMLLMCGWAMAETTTPDVTGVWYGDLFGVVCTLTISEDGTYVIENEDIDPEQGLWCMDGDTLVLDKDTFLEMRLSVSADMLVVDFEGMLFRFTREVPEAFVPAAVNTAAEPAQFEGQWSMTHLTSMGLLFDGNTLDVQISLNITGSNAVACISTDDTDESRIYEADMTGVFENGTLTLTEILPEKPTLEPEVTPSPASLIPPVPMVWTLQLLEDGTMCLTDAMEADYPVFVYLTPVMPLPMAE